MGFTKEQLTAIEERGKNLLVSAAAGSGKTTVLVERIIGRVLDENNPVDIDKILVMTFTKAAAEQMKEKILKAIEDERSKNPMDKYLAKQATLVHNAKISTIHGFCLDVIRNHFQEIGLNPDFRVADEGECRLLKQEVFQNVIEKAYEEATDEFIVMTECLSAGKSDAMLEDILNELYEYAMSNPSPEAWLKNCVDLYNKVTVDSIDQQPWMTSLLDNTAMLIRDAGALAAEAYDMCNQAGGPLAYAQTIEKDIELLEDLCEHKSYVELRDRFAILKFPTLARIKKEDEVDEELKDKVKDLRDGYKKSIASIGNTEFSLSAEEQIELIKKSIPVVTVLIDLTSNIIEEYNQAKRDKNIVDFNDLEHMCIEILAADDGSTAREYREFFEEIYVDEYQDSNLTQEELLKYIARDNNLFMVGDVKQSIYSFRLARPSIFMEKYTSFGVGDINKRIDLHHNFRSRASVLKSVNELFKQIMTSELGGIEYDDVAALHPGAEYPEVEPKLEKTELMLINADEDIDAKTLEAKAIAYRIKQLMKEQLVFDSDSGSMRPVKYSDIVILLRSAKGYDEKIKNVLSQEGIPVHVMSATGYFSAREVALLLDYLRILDNPLQDIAMAACLRSVLGRFTDEELAKLRIEYREEYLYDALHKYSDDGKDIGIINKCRSFLADYNELRKKVSYTSVYELLSEIIDGEYGIHISASQDGKRKMANLNMLLKKAKDYGDTSYKGLFHFVRYIEMLKKYEIDYGEANVLDENDDAVRIMTIHKSKGLEFPVCFIAGMNKKYNLRDISRDVIPDVDLGLGVPVVEPMRRIKCNTIIKKAISRKQRLETLAEEERILYVAMTRAKEKLIMTGVVKDIEKALAQTKGVIKCGSYMDLVLYGLKNGGLCSVNINTFTAATIVGETVREAINMEAVKERMYKSLEIKDLELPVGVEKENTGGFYEVLLQRLDYEYPYRGEKNLFEKVSVSELKRRSMHETVEDKELPKQYESMFEYKDEVSAPTSAADISETLGGMEEYIPAFIKEDSQSVSPALHGTAVHRIYEIWDYSRDTDEASISEFFDMVRNNNLMEDTLLDCISIGEVKGFLESSIAKRMKDADERGLLFREQPFVFSTDNMLVQGIIDAYFIEDDQIVIVDYKTDKVHNAEALIDRYHVQLEYYGKALASMLEKKVKEMIIYSTRHKKTVNIPVPVLN